MIKIRTNQDIIDVAKFLLFAVKKGGGVYHFPRISKELCLSKERIINIFQLFQKAKVFQFSFMPWNNGDLDNYDFKPTPEIIESKTDGFVFGDWSPIFEAEEREAKGLPKKPIRKMPKFQWNPDVLENIIQSEKEMNKFLKTYGRFYDKTIGLPSNEVARTSPIIFGKLGFNKETGEFSFFDIVGRISPNSQEFKILKTLLLSKDHQATYHELITIISPAIIEATKANKPMIHTIINHLKRKLGILDAKKRGIDRDIFQLSRNHGYRLIEI